MIGVIKQFVDGGVTVWLRFAHEFNCEPCLAIGLCLFSPNTINANPYDNEQGITVEDQTTTIQQEEDHTMTPVLPIL